ncbi:MAG: discoidin domain-containing protein, partial [Candidatus Eremiobacteraeota bacterium]|nr:discoidin domain-containing protein [Candidatus Eremiobacteraeota bacterium]
MNLISFVLAATTVIAIHVDSSHPVNVVRPLHAIGAGIDSDPEGEIPVLYAPERTQVMLGAGLGVVSYRLYTELSIQDWHWNPAGSFSDPQRGQGYWTSNASPTSNTIVNSFGYTLPHRGSSRDQGDDDGYSRIDDGNPSTYWKSNPYLAQPFTGDPNADHPQWAVVDFIHPKEVDAIRIAWVNPYATRYVVQYWTGGDAILAQDSGRWHTFMGGVVDSGHGGLVTLRLAPTP